MPDANSAGPARRPASALVAVALALLTAAVLAQVLGHGFLEYDDDLYVTNNKEVLSGLTWDGVTTVFRGTDIGHWHPLTFLSHMVDVELFGLNPAGHHLTNLVFHMVNTLLLFWLLLSMTGARWRSAFVAALFAVHPLHVEPVAWISSRKDVLSTCLLFLTIAAYRSYVAGPALRRYVLVAALYALGLMAKPMLVTLPVLLLVLDYWPLGRFSDPRQTAPGSAKRLCNCALEKVPLLAFAAASCLMTYLAGRAAAVVDTGQHFPLALRMANVLTNYTTYLWKTVWPARLAAFYLHPGPALLNWKLVFYALVLILATLAVFRLRRRAPYLLAGWSWYGVSLLPVSGIIQIGAHSMADRYTYVPLIGPFIMVAWGLYDLVKRSRRARMAMAAAAIVAVLALAGGAWRQASYWRNDEALFRHAVDVTRNNSVARVNLAAALLSRNNPAEAVEFLEDAVAISPNDEEAHYNLGCAYLDLGSPVEAARHFRNALRIKPGHVEAQTNLGVALLNQGMPERAAEELERAVAMEPRHAPAHLNLGVALINQGRPSDSLEPLQRALELDPNNPSAHYNAGLALFPLNRTDEAIAHFAQALRLDPLYADARYRMANLLLARGELEKAAKQYAALLEQNPDHVGANINLGIALASQGKIDEAVSLFRQALVLNPNHPDAHCSLGNALLLQQAWAEAEKHFLAALDARREDAEACYGLAAALVGQHKTAEAAQLLRKVLRVEPNHQRARQLLDQLGGPAPVPP